jgi:hypothetical protein
MKAVARDLSVSMIESLGTAGYIEDTQVRKLRSRLGQNWIGATEIEKVVSSVQGCQSIRKLGKDFAQLKSLIMTSCGAGGHSSDARRNMDGQSFDGGNQSGRKVISTSRPNYGFLRQNAEDTAILSRAQAIISNFQHVKAAP